MSTLTKVLIVLLSLSTIFLSGTMVTFVATSANFKDEYETQKSKVEALENETALFDQRFAEKTSQMMQQEIALQTKIQELELQLSDSKLAQRTAKTERDDFEIKYKTLNGVMTGFQSTIDIANKTKDRIQSELAKSLEELNNLKAELNISEANQAEKNVYIDKLKAKVKYLTETKSIYEAQIAQLSKGNPITPEEPVTIVSDFATPASEVPANASLKGVVTEVFDNDVVISLGSVDGVTKKNVFHISRGAEFICNVKITSVDTNKSAGVIELKLEQPKVGDTANNEL